MPNRKKRNLHTSTLGAGALFGAEDDDRPKAYLNYLFFDGDLSFDDDFGYDAVSSAALNNWEKLSITTVAPKPGYMYIYVANESMADVDVYFDDLNIKLTEGPATQLADYYPFGLKMEARSYAREHYRFGYQGQFAEMDEETGWNSFELRMYDPIIGRFITKDPANQYYSPYLGMGNNPISNVDPTGGVVNPIYGSDGTFRGVDEFGLQGEAIIYDGAFTNGMSQSDILNNGGTFFSDLSSLARWNFMEIGYPHWQALSLRPDWDGVVTIDEGVAWALAHPNATGTPDETLYLDAGQMSFGSLSTSDFSEEGQTLRVNLLYTNNPLNARARNTTYALGNTRVQLMSFDKRTIRVLNDAYDWDYHSGSAPKTLIRNGLIWGERQRTGINDNHGIPIAPYGLGVLNK
jgi:RHS repeat-associated protein